MTGKHTPTPWNSSQTGTTEVKREVRPCSKCMAPVYSARAEPVCYTCIQGAADSHAALVEALELCGVGGNHLANYLIGRLGAGFADKFPPGTAHEVARSAMNMDDYEVWCCWNAIARSRAALQQADPTKAKQRRAAAQQAGGQ